MKSAKLKSSVGRKARRQSADKAATLPLDSVAEDATSLVAKPTKSLKRLNTAPSKFQDNQTKKYQEALENFEKVLADAQEHELQMIKESKEKDRQLLMLQTAVRLREDKVK